MFFDRGASRTVIQTESPLRSHLSNIIPSHGSCTISNGTKLPYVETGTLTANNQATVVEGLEFDLYSAVAAAKRGISAVIDFDPISGENRSYTYCKDSGEISPLVERRHGALEVPVHLLLSRQDTVGLVAKDLQGPGKSFCLPQLLESKLPRAPVPDISRQYRPFEISAFWNSFDTINPSLESRQDNTTELSLFTFDVNLLNNEIRTSSYTHVSRTYLARRYYSSLRMVTPVSLSRENFLTYAAPAWKANSGLKRTARKWIDIPMVKLGNTSTLT
jgi:hypothetical protein